MEALKMISIYEVSIMDLLPPNLKEDPDMIAAAKAVDNDFLLLTNEVKQCILLPRIEEITDPDLIDLLAWQMHVDFYDYSLPLIKKIELIKNSVRWHRIKGTPQAVIDVATSIFGRTKLKEWFEYGGNPYFFKLDVDITGQGASSENLAKLEKLVNAYKNTRSWIDGINISLCTEGNIYLGATTMIGEKIVVYPWTPSKIAVESKTFIAVNDYIQLEKVIVYPRKEES
jgi:phage tail P2-like protein